MAFGQPQLTTEDLEQIYAEVIDAVIDQLIKDYQVDPRAANELSQAIAGARGTSSALSRAVMSTMDTLGRYDQKHVATVLWQIGCDVIEESRAQEERGVSFGARARGVVRDRNAGFAGRYTRRGSADDPAFGSARAAPTVRVVNETAREPAFSRFGRMKDDQPRAEAAVQPTTEQLKLNFNTVSSVMFRSPCYREHSISVDSSSKEVRRSVITAELFTGVGSLAEAAQTAWAEMPDDSKRGEFFTLVNYPYVRVIPIPTAVWREVHDMLKDVKFDNFRSIEKIPEILRVASDVKHNQFAQLLDYVLINLNNALRRLVRLSTTGNNLKKLESEAQIRDVLDPTLDLGKLKHANQYSRFDAISDMITRRLLSSKICTDTSGAESFLSANMAWSDIMSNAVGSGSLVERFIDPDDRSKLILEAMNHVTVIKEERTFAITNALTSDQGAAIINAMANRLMTTNSAGDMMAADRIVVIDPTYNKMGRAKVMHHYIPMDVVAVFPDIDDTTKKPIITSLMTDDKVRIR